jgi:hypothetical protein
MNNREIFCVNDVTFSGLTHPTDLTIPFRPLTDGSKKHI